VRAALAALIWPVYSAVDVPAIPFFVVIRTTPFAPRDP